MAPVTLPPSFFNSFWSTDYRTGLEVLFKNLEQGCLENNDTTEFIESQIQGHRTLAQTLLEPPLPSSSNQTSSSLQHTLLSLRGASAARGEAHKALAGELEQRVLAGFGQWKERHQKRVHAAKDEMLSKAGAVGVWEKDAHKLSSLRQTYLVKSRAADDSEDDAKFAPAPNGAVSSPPLDTYTSSPTTHSHSALRRSGTVTDRINEKLRAASIAKSPETESKPLLTVEGKTLPPPPSPLRPVRLLGNTSPDSPTEEKFVPPAEPNGRPAMQGKGKVAFHDQSTGPPVPSKTSSKSSVSDFHTDPVLLSGLAFPLKALKDLLRRFDAHLIGEPAPYSDAAVSAYPSRASAIAITASRQRSTILGTYEKAFSGEEFVSWLRENIEGLDGDLGRCEEAATELHKRGYVSRIGVGRGFEASYDTFFILKTNPPPTAGSTASPLSPTTTTNLQSIFKSYLPSGLAHSDEPVHVRMRREAAKADEDYREGVRSVEARRLYMEESIETGMRIWERWERERLGAVKSVLKTYDEAIARLSIRLEGLVESTTLSVEAFNPDADLKALIEGNRTGQFRPQPHIYDYIESDVPDVNFGIDLRRWSGETGWKSSKIPERPKGAIPDVLSSLLSTLTEMYKEIPDEERRRSWIYEVPLHETHALRNDINNSDLSFEDMTEIIKKFNVPVVAGVVKLYLLELNPPVVGWEGWEDAKAVYPAVGADLERDVTNAVTSVLGRLPGAQLYVLDAVVKHYKDLIDSTKSEETNAVYTTKLSLSVGRCFLRPQHETDITIGDRTAALFLADLINLYSAVFPSLIEKKKRESHRVMPTRKRTALVDQRISRSSLGKLGDPHQLLEQQNASRSPKSNTTPSARTLASALELGAPVMEKPGDEKDDEKSNIEQPNFNKPVFVSPPSSPVLAPVKITQTERSWPPHIQPGNASDNEESNMSPTASILESMEQIAHPEDTTISSGNADLKRNTSGETSRLRGPRVARGPRPAPGRVVSQSTVPTASEIPAVPAEDTETTQNERSGSVGVPGDYAPRKGRSGTSAGKFGHSGKGSVSQAVAQFENRS